MEMGKSISQQTSSLDKKLSKSTKVSAKKDEDMDHFEDQMNAALDQPI